MINNIKNIIPLLHFDNENEFYFIQIFQRRKDNPDMKLGVKRIKSYCVYSYDDLMELMPSIERYCNQFNARAYLRLNKQNATDVTLRCIEQLTKNLREGNPKKGRKVWDSVAGQGGKRSFWVLDVDKEHLDHNPKIIFEIEEMLILHFANVRGDVQFTCRQNPTKSGVHIIVPPFDTREMRKVNEQFQEAQLPQIDIQKDANTLIYAP